MEDSKKESKTRKYKEEYAISLIEKLKKLSEEIKKYDITRGSK